MVESQHSDEPIFQLYKTMGLLESHAVQIEISGSSCNMLMVVLDFAFKPLNMK